MFKRVVVKIGGSLLSRPDFAASMTRWLQEARQGEPAALFVLLVGGGELVDQLRVLSARHGLSESAAHWLAIDLMAVNTRIVAELLPGLPVHDSLEQLQPPDRKPGVALLDPRQVLRQEEPKRPGLRIGESWDVTSDSIAARLATVLGGELILLKAAKPPANWGARDWQQLASAGFVDASFPRFVRSVLSADFCYLD